MTAPSDVPASPTFDVRSWLPFCRRRIKSSTAEGNAGARRRRSRWGLSPLTLRILAVNVLALATLVGGTLYLGQYQQRLIHAELELLKSEAALIAGGLGEGAAIREVDERYRLAREVAHQMVRRMVATPATRTRLYDEEGELLADSTRLVGPSGSIQIEELPPLQYGLTWSERLWTVVADFVSTVPSRHELPLFPSGPSERADVIGDTVKALNGDISATAWATREGRLVLTAAAPVQRFKQVLGAVLLSRDGINIDRAMNSVRLGIFQVFLVSLAVTVLMSFYLASAIARPIRRLADAAERVQRGKGRREEIPDLTGRRDEIGDLSGALRDATAAVWARMDAIERFAADVAHEIKNPLTSLRSAVETCARVNDPERQRRLLAIIQDDVQRLDRLISDISDASRLDAELSRAEARPVDLGAMLGTLVELHESNREFTPEITVELKFEPEADAKLEVLGVEGRLVQVFQNLIGNAISFSPPGGVVTIRTRAAGDAAEIMVDDQGPGIPEENLETIFDRFYTERPKSEKFGTHSGLGLSIARQIVQTSGGTIRASNLRGEDGAIHGARLTVRLPKA